MRIDTSNYQLLDPVIDPSGTSFNEPFAIAITPTQINGDYYAYVTNTGNNTVTVINLTTNTVSQVIASDASYPFSNPVALAISADSSKVYVVNNTVAGSISVITTSSNTVTAGLTDASLKNPVAMAIIPNSTNAYVVNNTGGSGNGSVSIMSLTSLTITGTVTDLDPASFNGPVSVVVSSDGSTAYVANFTGGSVSQITVSNNTVINNITGFTHPQNMAITPDGLYVYVADYGANTVKYITILDLSVVSFGSISAVNPYAIVINSSNRYAYITNVRVSGNQGISTIDTENQTFLGNFYGTSMLFPTFISLSSDTKKAYVVNSLSYNTITIIDLETKNFSTIINQNFYLTGSYCIAITSDGTRAYAGADSSVAIIDLLTNAIVGTVIDLQPATISLAFFIAITYNDTIAYVANLDGASISIIDIDPNSLTYNTVTGIVSDPNSTFNLPFCIAITPDDTRAYVLNNRGTSYGPNGSVSVIDIQDPSTAYVTGVVTDTNQTINAPYYIIITPDGKTAYVGNDGNNTVSIIDTDPNSPTYNTVTGIVSDPNNTFNNPYGMAFTVDGSILYVVNIRNNMVSIVDVATNTVVGVVQDENPATLDAPWPIVTYPAGVNENLALVVNIDNSTLSVITANLNPPTYLQVESVENSFLFQVDLMNHVTWQPSPIIIDGPLVSYNIYRDETLTQLVGVVQTGKTLEFYDHNCIPGQSYTYYLVSVDHNGNISLPQLITWTVDSTGIIKTYLKK